MIDLTERARQKFQEFGASAPQQNTVWEIVLMGVG